MSIDLGEDFRTVSLSLIVPLYTTIDDVAFGPNSDTVNNNTVPSDAMVYSDSSQIYLCIYALNSGFISKGSGGFSVDFSDNTNQTRLIGGDFGDVIRGGSGFNTLGGGGGSDLLIGGAGTDTFDGGSGNNTVSYEFSTTDLLVYLFGGQGYLGDARLDSYANIQNVRGGAGDDTIFGTSGNNVLEGGAGADELIGTGGTDTASYQHSSAAVQVDLARPRQVSTGDADGDILGSFTNLLGSAYGDTLAGDGAGNLIDGGAGGRYPGGRRWR